MTRKNYTEVADVLREINDRRVTNTFADMFEKEFKNFNRDFFIEYIEKGNMKVVIETEESLNFEISGETVKFKVLVNGSNRIVEDLNKNQKKGLEIKKSKCTHCISRWTKNKPK